MAGRTVTLQPNYRYSIVGKSGSGKTVFSVILACQLVPHDSETWQCWWLNTKRDPDDEKLARSWGFGTTKARKMFTLSPADGPIDVQCDKLCKAALERRNVLLVIDEYKQCVSSTRRAGMYLEEVHLRGRGLKVGLIGSTQEPVEIPRQLLSQVSLLYLFDVSYPADVKYVRTLYDGYERPLLRGGSVETGDPNGFFWSNIDGDAIWHYSPHVAHWHGLISTGSTPKPSKQSA
jgi:hypothetical protein